METFFKDKSKLFEAKITVDGTTEPLSECSARLILEFENKNLLFYGDTDNDGNCKFNIPPIKENYGEKGKVKLEIVAESTLFKPWEDEFELKQQKTLKAEIVRKQGPILKEENLKVQVEKKVDYPSVIFENIKKEGINKFNLLKRLNKVNSIITEVTKKYNLDTPEIKKVKEALKEKLRDLS